MNNAMVRTFNRFPKLSISNNALVFFPSEWVQNEFEFKAIIPELSGILSGNAQTGFN